MKALIVYAHPYTGSFNHAIRDTITGALTAGGKEFAVIDLYADGFRPDMSPRGLYLYSKEQFEDPLVERYQTMLMETDTLFFVFPVWWGDMPAILKGFLDKVFLPGWAYERTKLGLISGKLKHIKQAVVFNTLGGPVIYHNLILRFPVKRILANTTLKSCGVRRVKIVQFGRMKKSNLAKRQRWLKKVESLVSRLIK